jgi:hypothetical protein
MNRFGTDGCVIVLNRDMKRGKIGVINRKSANKDRALWKKW